MSLHLLKELRARSTAIGERWQRLLRLEPVRTALASPDTLVHLMPITLDTLFSTLDRAAEPDVTLETARHVLVPDCACGLNPYGAYFLSCEQAVVEELVLLQSLSPRTEYDQRDVANVIRAVRRLAASEIQTFCGLCVQQTRNPYCRLYAATG